MASTKQQQSLSNFCQRENLTALRDEAVSNYRNRIQSGKRTKMTSDERQILIDWFIEHLKTLEEKDAIQSLCEREIALLEEGYPQNTIASDLLGKYRHAIAIAIEQNHIHLTPDNSHRYTYQKRDTGEKVEAHSHYALTYLKYDSQTYQQLRNQTTDVNNQRQDHLQPVHLSSYTQQIQQLLHTPNTEPNQDLKLAIAIASATGRRHTEVLSKGTFTLTNHPYLLHFQGQQKKQKGDDTSFDILTILPATEVMSAIERFRAIPAIAHLHGLPSSNTQVKSFNVQVNRMVIKLFQETGIVPVLPEKKYVSIHRLRGVYGAIAIHYFCPQSQHQHRFLQHYLGHTLSEVIAPNSSATPHYFHYYLVDDDHKPLTDKGILLSEFPLLDHPSDRNPPSFPPETVETVTTQPKTSPLSTSPSSLSLIPSQLSETLQSELEKGLSSMLDSDSYTVIMAGLMAVTGRSPGELLKSATFEPHDDQFTLLFSPTGLGAKYPLKTLVPGSVVLETRQRLQKHEDVQDLLYATPNQINSHCLPYLSGAIASHLPFDDLDSTLENYTQLTNNYNYTPRTSLPLNQHLEEIAHRLQLQGTDEQISQAILQWVSQQLDFNAKTDSTLERLRPVFEKLDLSGSSEEMVDGLFIWVSQQLDSQTLSSQASVDPLLAQTISHQAQTLAWFTQRLESLKSEQNNTHLSYSDPNLQSSLETKIQKLQQDNTDLKQQLSQLQKKHHQLQQENQEMKLKSERFEVARQALLGKQLSLPIETENTPKKTEQNNPPKTPKKQTRKRNDSAVERAKTITSAILQWNLNHPDDSWAVNRGLLEKTFGINRPAAGLFLEFHSSLVTQVNQVGNVKNVRSHNRRKDPTLLKSFVDTFVSKSSR